MEGPSIAGKCSAWGNCWGPVTALISTPHAQNLNEMQIGVHLVDEGRFN